MPSVRSLSTAKCARLSCISLRLKCLRYVPNQLAHRMRFVKCTAIALSFFLWKMTSWFE